MPNWLRQGGILIVLALVLVGPADAAGAARPSLPVDLEESGLRRRINLVVPDRRRTPNPPGWEEYDGSPYTKERGHGWLEDIAGRGWDGGGRGEVILPDGTRASPIALGRFELGSWQGTHQENLPLVFRIDLPDGWYRVTCTSVDPDNAPLPLIDTRSIKFRAHDVVFAGPSYGPPLKVEGNRLVEGSSVVEVTEGHLRIVVGDPAYGGWTWSFDGPWYRGWRSWFGRLNHQRYAMNWHQRLTRHVDPGFHSLRFNSLVVQPVVPPAPGTALVYRDFLNRNDDPDINAGVPDADHWVVVPFDQSLPDAPRVDVYKTSLRITGLSARKSTVGIIQEKESPPSGIVRYSTRVSLFTGEGSMVQSGAQEAGLSILGALGSVNEFRSTFIGVTFDANRPEGRGGIILRVGNGLDGFITDQRIPDTLLGFEVAEGEYEIVADHDVDRALLSRLQINGVDVTHFFSTSQRTLPIRSGAFGLRSSIDPRGMHLRQQQFYWYYRVEVL